MLSDETFPIEYDDDEIASAAGSSTTTLTAADSSSLNQTSTIDWSRPNIGSTSCEEATTTQEDTNSSVSTTLNVTEKDSKPLPPLLPRAPSKKRISFSCQDLYFGAPTTRRNTYDHVQSKVKKIIEENSSRRKPLLSRHKSMIVSFQTAADDPIVHYDNAEKNELIQELKQKSSRIIELVGKCDEKDNKLTELEERCDEKDSRIYSLEFDRSRMRLTFDKLRAELQAMKEKEEHYKLQLAMSSPPSRHLRHCATQTQHDEAVAQNPIVRELKFMDCIEDDEQLDNTHFSDMNNASDDNLIPSTPEIHMDELTLDDGAAKQQQQREVNIDEAISINRRKTKKRGFLRIFSCVSVQSAN